MFLRILIWLALLVAGWMFLRPRGKGALRGGPSAARDTRDARGARTVAPPEAMIHCEYCGVHLPESEAVRDADGRGYCSVPHRAMGPR